MSPTSSRPGCYRHPAAVCLCTWLCLHPLRTHCPRRKPVNAPLRSSFKQKSLYRSDKKPTSAHAVSFRAFFPSAFGAVLQFPYRTRSSRFPFIAWLVNIRKPRNTSVFSRLLTVISGVSLTTILKKPKCGNCMILTGKNRIL